MRTETGPAAVVVQSKTFAYSDGMNLTSITDTVAAAQNVALWHSPSNRLTSADGPWGQTTFSYDPIGNRTYDVNTLNAVTTTRVQWYPANSNRMTDMTENGASFRVFTHDAGGNITQEVRPGAETFDYTYNNRNRMSAVTRNGAAYATYIYNALEQLVSRNTAAPGGPVGTVHYIYDTDGHLIAEANAATGATTREYLWLPSNDNSNDTLAEDIIGGANDNTPDLPLAVIEGASTYYVHTDHLGRPTRMTDAARATVWQATWKPWGEIENISGTILNNLRFPGQYFQIETNLAYNHHRHYDPVTGRYTQPDPLGFVDGPSIYAYAGNSPFMNVDRDGRHITSDGTPNGPRINVPLPGGLFLDMLIHNHPTDAQMCTVDDRYALKACLAAARGDEDAWHAYCGASGISPPVDFKRPGRCYRKTHESKVNRQGWCYNEFGNH